MAGQDPTAGAIRASTRYVLVRSETTRRQPSFRADSCEFLDRSYSFGVGELVGAGSGSGAGVAVGLGLGEGNGVGVGVASGVGVCETRADSDLDCVVLPLFSADIELNPSDPINKTAASKIPVFFFISMLPFNQVFLVV